MSKDEMERQALLAKLGIPLPKYFYEIQRPQSAGTSRGYPHLPWDSPRLKRHDYASESEHFYTSKSGLRIKKHAAMWDCYVNRTEALLRLRELLSIQYDRLQQAEQEAMNLTKDDE